MNQRLRIAALFAAAMVLAEPGLAQKAAGTVDHTTTIDKTALLPVAEHVALWLAGGPVPQGQPGTADADQRTVHAMPWFANWVAQLRQGLQPFALSTQVAAHPLLVRDPLVVWLDQGESQVQAIAWKNLSCVSEGAHPQRLDVRVTVVDVDGAGVHRLGVDLLCLSEQPPQLHRFLRLIVQTDNTGRVIHANGVGLHGKWPLSGDASAPIRVPWRPAFGGVREPSPLILTGWGIAAQIQVEMAMELQTDDALPHLQAWDERGPQLPLRGAIWLDGQGIVQRRLFFGLMADAPGPARQAPPGQGLLLEAIGERDGLLLQSVAALRDEDGASDWIHSGILAFYLGSDGATPLPFALPRSELPGLWQCQPDLQVGHIRCRFQAPGTTSLPDYAVRVQGKALVVTPLEGM